MLSHTIFLVDGSSPVVGSSKKRISGACINALAISQRRFHPADRALYEALLLEADEVWLAEKDYGRSAYFRRNDHIVEKSGRLIAVYDGKAGGTAYTVRAAIRAGLPIEYIAPSMGEREAWIRSYNA